ncbi:enoyl-CoA hydratase [Planococcaceae bacterium Storch 2/2-2]|nr:enoyl-CoA hydratase [Planococcaceae bacterium Storch 2/2-2]
MFDQKKRELGKTISELELGDSISLVEKINDRELLLYLGLTNDANPLFLQHDYCQLTKFQRPIVPTTLLTGIVASAISKYLPGPGAHIVRQRLEFPHVVHHYETLTFSLEVVKIDEKRNEATIQVGVQNEEDIYVLTGTMIVAPPKPLAEESEWAE